MNINEKLIALSIVLPNPPTPIANFSNYVFQGDLLYISGQGPIGPDGARYVGRVGNDYTLDEAKKFARLVGINIVAVLKAALNGDWNRFDHFVKINGYVNSSDQFFRQPEVIDGCSDLLVELFGERGKHARTAIGVSALPFNIPVEIEAIIALKS